MRTTPDFEGFDRNLHYYSPQAKKARALRTLKLLCAALAITFAAAIFLAAELDALT